MAVRTVSCALGLAATNGKRTSGDDLPMSEQAYFTGAGLVSTAEDFNAFAQMLLNGGRLGNERILSRPSVELMTSDQLSAEQKLGSELFFADNRGWGFGVSVLTRRDHLCNLPGRFGWEGGYGTSWYSDPKENLTGILLTQRMMDSPQPPRAMVDFWTLAYQVIDD